MSTFGIGNYGGYNDWVFTGSNNFYTSWGNTPTNPGANGRVTNIAVRVNAYSGLSGACAVHHGLYWSGSPYPRQTYAGDYTMAARGAGTTEDMPNQGVATTYWIPNIAHYMGFMRDPAQSDIFAFQDGAYSGYAGKSAADSDINGGTNNYNGVGNPGAVPAYTTYMLTSVYVKRGGVWTQTFVYINRGGGGGNWGNCINIYVNRGGGGNWTLLNKYLQESERHIPVDGMPVMVDTGDGLERGWVAEEGRKGWFGSLNPTRYSKYFDWKKTGGPNPCPLLQHDFRYNSEEPQEWVETRQFAKTQVMRCEAEGKLKEAEIWKCLTKPETEWAQNGVTSLMSLRTSKLTQIVSDPKFMESWSLRQTRRMLLTTSLVGAASDTSAKMPGSSSRTPILVKT